MSFLLEPGMIGRDAPLPPAQKTNPGRETPSGSHRVVYYKKSTQKSRNNLAENFICREKTGTKGGKGKPGAQIAHYFLQCYNAIFENLEVAMSDFYKCSMCGKTVKIIAAGKGQILCCDQPLAVLANFKSVQEVLDFAIEKEEEAKQFYLEWSEKLENKALREQFVLFAGEENKHREKLLRVKSGSTFKPAAKKVTDLKIVDYLVDITPTPEMDYQEALIVAMRREKASFKLYSDLAAMADDEGLRETFLALAQEEAKHKLRLETEYEKEIYSEN
jgi:desulfoferrodoxin-like iron-binding protein